MMNSKAIEEGAAQIWLNFRDLKNVLIKHLAVHDLDETTAYRFAIELIYMNDEINVASEIADLGYQAIEDIQNLRKAEDLCRKIDLILGNLSNPLDLVWREVLLDESQRLKGSIIKARTKSETVASLYNDLVEKNSRLNKIGPPKRKRGRPKNHQANEVACKVAAFIRVITKKNVSITKNPYMDKDVRSGLFIELLKDIFDNLGLGPSQVVSAAEYAVTQQRTQK